jgi:hypothetical protein
VDGIKPTQTKGGSGLLPAVPEQGDAAFLARTAGINLSNDSAPIIRAGFYVPLVEESRAWGAWSSVDLQDSI